MFLELILATAIIPSGQNFDCTPIRVWDGDGPIWCAEGVKVRLSGIAAREMNETCLKGHPCPKKSAIEARDALVNLIGVKVGLAAQGHILVQGPAMKCLSVGGAGGNRTAAFCVSPKSGDLSCAMVKGGWALQWNKYWGDHKCN